MLRTGVGDCNEHTTLFVALARAAGVPSRMNVGVAHQSGRFFYHAWPEVWLPDRAAGEGGHWVPVDPTWDEVRASGTHLRLDVGGGQSRSFQTFGRIRFELVEVGYREY